MIVNIRLVKLEYVQMSQSPYDLTVLQERAQLWRAEAEAATRESMRIYCLTEADRCQRRVHLSLSTPVFRETRHNKATRPEWPAIWRIAL
jgi:hypothetical protein